ncbi:hypothetical protein LTR91_017012 [Friedmanniomyces endolithicus]|uniref:MIND kinetochore complex component Nnf1 n=1 Tax=Friedmanniomyces endolithicus TaxID=329885 RepID=A0AAN6K7E2_9PEZI|nr:hypothetical protein LTR35_016716 [Friedmanniomyces endolithicus]KAK0299855.1 hypothetical protein LTS00_001625 [Friedmanniomyces endolithicus]KAK0317941.1 hypothetical protein LTR82_010931 [Friedmanniomyces endolithicus]KAK0897733.1 hypothetical protein LTR57_021975 [Friedmanniomyces endolithicus]KAK0966260.1 hypothetical protein LTS01_017870 [Friedmanniomyces endolithicus]
MATTTITTTTTHSPSPPPSPPPQPPTLSLPGPRATALLSLYNDAIAHLLKTLTYPHFAACFPTPSFAVPGSMKALHAQFTAKLGEQLHAEFDRLVEEREAVGALNGLDGLVEEARGRRERAERGRRETGGEGGAAVPPHTLPPRTLYLSHLAPTLRRYHAETQQQSEGVRAENVEILARIQKQREDIAARVAGLEQVVADVDACVAALRPEELEVLREEVRGVDEGMRMEV